MKTLLYVSELAEEAPASVVGAITKTARSNNARYGIQGMLIFDGVRFAQMLEGPAPAIDGLLQRLACDRRHVNMQVLSLHEQVAAGPFAGWDLGYLWIDDDETDGIVQLLRAADATAAEAVFLALAADADRSGVPSAAAPL